MHGQGLSNALLLLRVVSSGDMLPTYQLAALDHSYICGLTSIFVSFLSSFLLRELFGFLV
jgi:hypothetical protein